MSLWYQHLVEFNDYLWLFSIFFLLSTGIIMTIYFHFPQIFRAKQILRSIFPTKRELAIKNPNKEKGLSSFQSLSTAVASQIGTGNLVGTASAIALGGPGSIFWMWVGSFFGMATILVEAILAQLFRKEVGGVLRGGPAFYMLYGMKNKTLAFLFAILAVITLTNGIVVQSNSIAGAIHRIFPQVHILFFGIGLSFLAIHIFQGGGKSIGHTTEFMVPIMAIVYILTALYLLLTHVGSIIPMLKQVVSAAFHPSAVLGATAGIGIQQTMRYGFARGLFANEAGMGTTPHAHAVARAKYPSRQGFAAMFGVALTSFFVVTLTGLIITISLPFSELVQYEGIQIVAAAFSKNIGTFGDGFIAIAIFFFAFSTIIGWFFFAETNISFLISEKYVRLARKVFVYVGGLAIIGGFLLHDEANFIWQMTDLFNGFMILPNLFALFMLKKKAKDTYLHDMKHLKDMF